VLDTIHRLGLDGAVLELEAQGYTILRNQLTPAQVERAKAGIVARVERTTGRRVNLDDESGASFKGMQYIPYMLYEDPVYEDILMNEKPLALVTWLLGESCLLSSIGCHFRGPGGMPLMLHSDNGNGMPPPFSSVAMTANVNYALTPYSKAAGALGIVPGSHTLCRQPTAHENFRPANMSAEALVAKQRAGAGVDDVEWRDPPGFVAMDLMPGDVVIWHGNTWHGGYRRELPGMRMNLAVFFNRQHVQTQERHRDQTPPEVLQRRGNDERFLRLLGAKQPYGWTYEGPDYSVMGRVPVGQFD
jgi:ectoine hydroxylase-related dioxygenase (phytanoyl-CoA dioxygenase family)